MATTTGSRRGSMSRRRKAQSPSMEMADNRVVLYIRASTTDQQHTLDSQAFDAKRFAEANGRVICETFIDSGVSGSKPFLQRKEAKRAVAYLMRESIGTLLVLKLDRAFRNTVDMHQTIDFLLDKGITFRVANPDMDFKGPFGRLIATVLGAIAEFELGCRAERQQGGFEAMRRNRIARSQYAPFGWQIGPEIPVQTAKSGKPYRQLIPDPTEQDTLREIIGMYDRRETLQAIADTLNDRGIKTKRAGSTVVNRGRTITISGEWKPSTVKSVLEHAELADEDEMAQPQTTNQHA